MRPGAVPTSKDTNSEHADSNRLFTTTTSKSSWAANSMRAVSNRRWMTSGVSVPRPTSLAFRSSQLGGARNTVMRLGHGLLDGAAPARSTSISTGSPGSAAVRTGSARVPDRCSPPWISAHSSSSPSSMSCWKRAATDEVVVDAVDLARPRCPRRGRDTEMQVRDPLAQTPDHSRLTDRGGTGQHDHASRVRSPVGAQRLPALTGPVRSHHRPSGLHRVGWLGSRTFPAGPCADGRRDRAGGGSGRSPAQS